MLITDGYLFAKVSMTMYDGIYHWPDMSQDLLEGAYQSTNKYYGGERVYKVDNVEDVESYIYDWENYDTEYDTEEDRQYDKDMGLVRCGMFYIIDMEEQQ